jgi:signal transduction histidine kinase
MEFHFKRFLFDILECYQSDFLAPDYHIDIEVPDELYLFSYPSAFNQIYRYALNNCIKHAKIPGKTLNITLSALVINDYVHFYIKDDGHGISKELLPVVFEPFVTSKRNQGGTGLGLSITYNLVTQKLGGQVKIQSLEQGGACLHIILPSSCFILKED